MRGRRRRKVNTRRTGSPQVHKAHRYAPQANTPSVCACHVPGQGSTGSVLTMSPSKPPDQLSLCHVGHKCSREAHSCENLLKLTFLQGHYFPPALLDLLANTIPACHAGNFFPNLSSIFREGGKQAGNSATKTTLETRVWRALPMEVSHSST